MAKGDKLKGRIQEAAGDLIDDPEVRRDGRLKQREAEAREELARAEDAADAKAREVAELERDTESYVRPGRSRVSAPHRNRVV